MTNKKTIVWMLVMLVLVAGTSATASTIINHRFLIEEGSGSYTNSTASSLTINLSQSDLWRSDPRILPTDIPNGTYSLEFESKTQNGTTYNLNGMCGGSDWTFSAWFKLPGGWGVDDEGKAAILSGRNGLSYWNLGYVDKTAGRFGTLILAAGVGGSVNLSTDISGVNDTNWHHLGVVRKNSNGALSMYIDGVLIQTVVPPFTGYSIIECSADIHHFFAPYTTLSYKNFTNLRMDNVQVFGTHKSANQIYNLYLQDEDHNHTINLSFLNFENNSLTENVTLTFEDAGGTVTTTTHITNTDYVSELMHGDHTLNITFNGTLVGVEKFNVSSNITQNVQLNISRLIINFTTSSSSVLNLSLNISRSGFTAFNSTLLSNQSITINLYNENYTLYVVESGRRITEEDLVVNESKNLSFVLGLTLNLTFYDEETEEIITQNGTVNVIPIDTDEWNNYSLINGSASTFAIYRQGWYRIDYVFDTYNKRSYYYNKVNDNTSDNLSLYSLATASADFVVIHVEDESANELSNVTVKLFRSYPSQSEYRVVEMARTDENGDAVFSVVPNEQWYYLSFEYKGRILLVSDPQKFSVTTYTFTLFLTEDYTGIIDDLNAVYGVVNYTNASNNFRFIYDDPNQKITEACLDVEQMVFGRPTLVCSNCSTATAATLLCNMASESNGTYTGQGFVTLSGKKYLVSSWGAVIGNDWGSKLPSTFLSFFVVLGFVGMAAFNPVAAVVLTLIGIIFSALLNIAWLSWGSVIGLIIVGGVIIVKKGVNL